MTLPARTAMRLRGGLAAFGHVAELALDEGEARELKRAVVLTIAVALRLHQGIPLATVAGFLRAAAFVVDRAATIEASEARAAALLAALVAVPRGEA